MQIKVEYGGSTYSWDGHRWADTDGLIPSKVIQSKLHSLARPKIDELDDAIVDPSLMTREAQIAADQRDFRRALRFCYRALELSPDNDGRAATLVSVLRKAGRSEEALPVLEQFSHSTFPPLLTTGAAVLCDVGRWEAALLMIRRALRGGRSDGEALAVYGRIRAARPDLMG